MKTSGNCGRNRRNQGGTKVEPRWNHGGTTVKTGGATKLETGAKKWKLKWARVKHVLN